MKSFATFAVAAAISLGLATPALAALKVGDKAPDFTTDAAVGTSGAKALGVRVTEPKDKAQSFTFTLSKALKKGPVVLYFFPAAFTSGCTVEAHEFAEASVEFSKYGATLIGLTAGNPERIKEFSSVECRDKFAVGLAKPEIISGYDVKLPQKTGWTNRTSYVIAKNGTIAYVLSDLSPAGHVAGTLAAVKALAAKKG